MDEELKEAAQKSLDRWKGTKPHFKTAADRFMSEMKLEGYKPAEILEVIALYEGQAPHEIPPTQPGPHVGPEAPRKPPAPDGREPIPIKAFGGY